MKTKNIDTFFNELSAYYNKPVDIILVGGAAAAIYGGVRPTLDVDFEAHLKNNLELDWKNFNNAIKEATEKTGIKAQFGEKIENWSHISWLDYQQHKMIYKKFGKVKVWILEPQYWAIGKVARYLDSDVQDMIAVFSKEKPDPYRLASLWRNALDESHHSSSLFNVKKQMIHFFSSHGKKIWGADFDDTEINKLFT